MSEPRASYAPAPDPLDSVFAGQQALSDRCERIGAALRVAAEALDEMADFCDRLRYADSALHYRRLARACRGALT